MKIENIKGKLMVGLPKKVVEDMDLKENTEVEFLDYNDAYTFIKSEDWYIYEAFCSSKEELYSRYKAGHTKGAGDVATNRIKDILSCYIEDMLRQRKKPMGIPLNTLRVKKIKGKFMVELPEKVIKKMSLKKGERVEFLNDDHGGYYLLKHKDFVEFKKYDKLTGAQLYKKYNAGKIKSKRYLMNKIEGKIVDYEDKLIEKELK